ncbi:hypothetical protein A2U01_0065373, partial [Trifolium medium]|nr:hypothetical protein [Trifolium medium]
CPAQGCQTCAREINIVLQLPVLALTDGDIGGFEIFTVYNKG